MNTAKFWQRTDEGQIQCKLCPHNCTIAEGRTGLCRVRRVEDGELKATGYGLLSSVNLDPIEKKPLYHFHPGTMIFSIGGWGCNFACIFCQNWTISQQVVTQCERYSPEDVVEKASASKSAERSIGIAYTYNEPLVAFEFVEDCARLARSEGLLNVLVTNGYIEPEPAAKLLPLIDALNIDIKSMDDAFYRRQCRGTLAPVQAFARQAVEAGCHVEITNLIIPGLNDDESQIEALAKWIHRFLGEAIPLHLSAYHPQYKLKVPATPTELLEHAHRICRKELLHVYLGNVLTARGQDTVCPQCGTILVARRGYTTEVRGIRNGVCEKCGRLVAGVM